jgi:hypothetical protein
MLVALLVLVAMVLGVIVGGQALLSLTGHRWGPTTYGFFLGAGAATVPWAIWMVTTQVDGSWSWRIGAVAERQTADALRVLGPAWRFRYNMVFYGGRIDAKEWVTDIDCVASGPGGILAVSTKWTSDRWNLADPTDDWLVAAARGASRNAERLAGPVRQLVRSPPITPVVVCWGPQLEPTDKGASAVHVPGKQYPEVIVVYGQQLAEWLPTLQPGRLTEEQITQVDRVVGDWIADHESRHSRSRQAQEQAATQLRWANQLSAVSAAVVVGATAWLVAAIISKEALRALVRFDRLGGGLGAALYLLSPVLLVAATGLYAHRAHVRAVQARVDDNRQGFACSVGALTMWVAGVVAALIFS